MNEDFYKKIEAYNLGQLPPPELERFEQAMRTDAALADAVRTQRTEWEAQELLAERLVRSQIREMWLQSPPAPTEPNWFSKNWKWLLPLLLVVGVAGFFFFKKPPEVAPALPENPQPTQPAPSAPTLQTPKPPNPETSKLKVPIAGQKKTPDFRQIAMAAYQVPNGLASIRGAENEDTLTLASKAFFEKNYRRTVELLRDLPENDRQEALSLRAHAHFAMKNFDAAARDFSDLETGGIYRREAQWFGLLARMATPGADKTLWLKQLDAIRLDAKHPYHSAAAAAWKQVSEK